ncbi:MAG: glycoside hydrolase family 78 protein [Treponema sp.]|jgi:alpha-L-rhamnosidase|nr:glycoside hydrolase family 78 protein [Treponema sp.]
MLKITEPRCEYRINPLGIPTAEPRFSWKIETDKTGVMQTAYNLQIALSGDFSGKLIDSGLVESGESHLVEIKGEQFPSSAKRFWRVKIQDNQGEESPWSETASFETSLLDKNGWKAVFISAEDEQAASSSAVTALRKEFIVSKKIKSARLYASAKGLYEAYCNGSKVGNEVLSPGFTEYGKRILFQTYDVTGLLKQGGNALGFMAGPGWYKGNIGWQENSRNLYGKRTAVIAQLLISFEDGTNEVIKSDASWLCGKTQITFAEIYHGETCDARLEEKGWSESGFDAKAWQPVFVESNDLSALFPDDGLPVTEHERFKPKAFFTTPGGDKVIDFGQNISGYVSFKVKGKAGDKVKIRHAEILDAAGNFYTKNLRTAKQAVEYTLKGGEEETYKPRFTFHGFRYIAVDEFPGTINPDSFEAVAVYSDMKPLGSFKSSEPLLNQFVSNVGWSMRDNFVDIPSDCPQRNERMGWTGDAEIFARSAGLIMETAPFFRKWLKCVAVSHYPDGRVPHVVPDVLTRIAEREGRTANEAGATAWADAAVIIPWMVYAYFGDKRILEEQYPSMKKWVEFIRGAAQDGALFNSGFHYGDWVALDAKEGSYFGATPNDLCATAFYAYSAKLLAKAAEIIGKKDEAEEYRKLYDRVAEAFGREFFTPTGRIAARTQTSCILPLHFGLCPPHAKERTLNTYIDLLKENNNHLTTGFLGTPFACRVLADNGRLDLAYELLFKNDFPSWLYQITKGATTIWEHWDGLKPDGTMWSPDMNSFNHYAYGAVYDWVFTDVGGIDTEEAAGFKRIVLKPRPGGPLSWAESSYESPYGAIYLRWEKQGNKIKLDVKVPPNTTAQLVFSGAETVLGSGKHSFEYDASGI